MNVRIKHTPGPWFVAVTGSGSIGVVDRKPAESHDHSNHNADPELVAFLQPAGGCCEIANACLIAAAPELLALAEVLASLNEHANAHLAEPIQSARALLARIERGAA